MAENKTIRIDKYLWSVRVYKTRSLASEACRKGKIIINDIPVKPSRMISENEIIVVKKPPVTFKFRVIVPIENRVSAKIVSLYAEDLTSDEEKAKLDLKQTVVSGFRDKGTGRPTKKERRLIDRLQDDFSDLK
jgi:ribosome-associated heat shock protein Hsp15